MAKTKLIIVHGTKIAGMHYAKGDILEVDLDLKAEADIIAKLQHAGRIALATPEVIKHIEEELANAEKDRQRELAAAERARAAGPAELFGLLSARRA